MRHTHFLCAAGMTLALAVVSGHQTAAPPTVSAALRGHLQDERFEIVTSIRGLPLGVREALQTLFGSQSLDIAEPGAEFQATDVVANPKLPSRRLIAAGCSRDHCLVYYERGGDARAWRAALFRWTPEGTGFEWGGVAPGGLTAIADVRKVMLSGEIKTAATSW